MKRTIPLILLVCFLLSFKKAGDDTRDSIIVQQAKLFEAVLRSVDYNFVDSLDVTRLTRVAIDAMMSSLDPYSRFFDEQETRDREKTWRGQLYAGIGAGVAPVNGQVVITDPYEGYGAHQNDLRTGDIIIEVDSINTKGLSFEEVLKKLRGEPGTSVTVKVDRPGIGEVSKKIVRQQIFTKSILYHGMIDDKTGYINVSQFLKGSDTKFRENVLELKQKGAQSLIIDMRDNIGGLVQEAINCLSCFLPKGTKVCSLKGIHPSGNYDYRTELDPVDTEMPLVILTNGVTVSSGEIFTGALQDLDRAVVVGQRTFGKGFVQGTRYPGFNTSIYLTAARYYTPSGRCIQELDYSSKYKNEKVVKMPDSLKQVYFTSTGRKVFNIGGIDPDIKTTSNRSHELIHAITSSFVFSEHATRFRNLNESMIDALTFRLPKSALNEFIAELKSEKVLSSLKISSDNSLNNFVEAAAVDGIQDGLNTAINKLRRDICSAKSKLIDENKAVIGRALEKEIIRRYLNSSGVFRYNMLHDNDLLVAKDLINDPAKYQTLLRR